MHIVSITGICQNNLCIFIDNVNYKYLSLYNKLVLVIKYSLKNSLDKTVQTINTHDIRCVCTEVLLLKKHWFASRLECVGETNLHDDRPEWWCRPWDATDRETPSNSRNDGERKRSQSERYTKAIKNAFACDMLKCVEVQWNHNLYQKIHLYTA